MPRFDLRLAELQNYRPTVREPADFDSFWADTLAESRAAAREPRLSAVTTPFTTLDVYDVTFTGYGGDDVKAWLTLPRNSDAPLPAVVEYNGYNGGRGIPVERIGWASAGYAHLLMDTRGQGSTWGSGGHTPDPHPTGPAAPGFMTRGIEDPSTYYYRRVYTDAALAIDAVRSLPHVDPQRVAVAGGSQGGGIAIAAAGLSRGLTAAMPDVPFLCHFERAVGMTDTDPYQEIVRYLSVYRHAEERVFDTLSYFDAVNHAARADAPGLFSVGLLDPICPPSTVFAAYNRYGAVDKAIEVYAHNQHEGGQSYQWVAQTEFLAGRV
ncbi:acetylxylan esterase [Microbacterium sp.]|uniref:acetylxylan esterase n=1 Tax=Microbacterium sp. TaxID=51671 RepID=UPI0039E6CE6B